MGQADTYEQERRAVTNGAFANWIQFATLLLAIVAFAMHVEGRLARIEQQMSDEKELRLEMIQQIDRLETRFLQRNP